MPTKTSSHRKSVSAAPSRSGGRAAGSAISGTTNGDSAVATEDPATEDTPVTVDARVDTNAAGEHDATEAVGVETASAVRPAKARSGGSKLSDEQIEYFQSLLLAERARLEEEREQIRSRSGAVDGALPEEGEGGDEDTADLAAAMMDKEMDLSVEDEIEDLLAAVDHALQKMEDGTYGVCDMAGETIPSSRLELIPWAALCVECQALAEGE